MNNPAVDPRIEPLLVAMRKDTSIPPNAEAEIRQALNESPYLSRLIGTAVEKRLTQAIDVQRSQYGGGDFQQADTHALGSAPHYRRWGCSTKETKGCVQRAGS